LLINGLMVKIKTVYNLSQECLLCQEPLTMMMVIPSK
jgi:hypothetical protein